MPLVTTLLTLFTCAAAEPRIVSVQKIWDSAPHNAFTDLIRFRGRWLCVFREGEKHVSGDGRLRVLESKDGKRWTSAALIESRDGDLRDAKIAVAPDGRLMLSGAVALTQPNPHRHRSLVWFSSDGRKWTEGKPVADADYWLWRQTFQGADAYGIGYQTNTPRTEIRARLYRCPGGENCQPLIPDLGLDGYPNESTIRFTRDGSALALVRRDPGTAMLGTARAPYTNWTWKDLGTRAGGPNFLILPDGRMVAAVRLYDGKQRTALCWLDPAAGTLKEFLTLPSDGDSSYAGLVWHKGELWMSYYSSHEGKTSIYLARIALSRATR